MIRWHGWNLRSRVPGGFKFQIVCKKLVIVGQVKVQNVKYIYIYPKPPPRRSSEYDGDHVYHLSTPRNSQRWHLSTLELRAPPTVKPSQMVKCLSRTDDLPCDGRGMDPEKQFSSIAVRNCTMFCFGCGCLMKYQLDPTGCQCMGVDETAHQASLQHG